MEFLRAHLNPEALGDPSAYAGIIYAIFIFMEITAILFFKRNGDYETRDASTSIFMGLGSVIIGLFLGAISLFFLFKIYEMRIMNIATTPLMLFALFIVFDYIYYWNHRLSHRIRWLWANHVVHHSSQHYNLSTALRQPWFTPISGLVILYTPVMILGVHPAAIAFIASVNRLYQFFIHTEAVVRFPRWVEAFFNTPSHHRVHHSTRPEHLDTNYGGTFIIWDKMHKTFAQEEENEAMEYGIVHNLGTFNPLRVATHEFVGIFKDTIQSGLKISERLAYVFAPPGWSHDRSRQTSDDIKREALEKNLVAKE